MTVKYGQIKMPSKIARDDKSATNTYCRFIAEPLEKGFGHTIGNSMRRMLLSSLEAPAIIAFRFEGVSHEYMAIEGVVEDMVNIVLNFKGACLRRLPIEGSEVESRESRILTSTCEITQEDLDKHGGQCAVTLGDLIKGDLFEVVNPDLHLFSVTTPLKKQIDIRVAFGRGYVPSERHYIPDRTTDEILIDAAFSPVVLATYSVENTRVGQDTDFDRLIIDIKTDGRITPTEALSFVAQIANKHYEVFSTLEEHELAFDSGEEEEDSDKDEMMDKLSKRIDEIELSVRSTNCLSGANIETIAELVLISEREMLLFRNFGKKSLNEIKEALVRMNMHLGMDLSKYGITRDNVKEHMSRQNEPQ